MHKRVGIYGRLSEEDRNKQNKEDDSNSIKNQKTMLINYAMENDWEIYNIYMDDDYTGADRNRPAFNQLLKDAEAGKFDIILCKTQSRFTRELELVEKYIHTLFPMWGIRFVSIVDNADSENKGNKKSRQINGLINEWYLEDMSENIKSVLTNRRIMGNHIGAFALYGYKKDPNKKGHLIIDEEAAKIVREVFTLFAQGYGKANIARILNDRGIPNPTEYKRLNGLRYSQPKGSTGTLWKYFAISDMLSNEIYIGNMVQGKYGSISYKTKVNKPISKEKWIRVENTHDPIIDIDLWNRVQELIKLKAKPFTLTGEIGIFSKKVKCKECGYTLHTHKNGGRHYLQCPTKNVSKDACTGAFISVKYLESVVLSEIKKLNDAYLNKNELSENIVIDNNANEHYFKMEEEINSYKKKIAEYDKGIKDLYFDKVKQLIDDNQFIEYSRDFYNEKSRLEKMVEDMQEKINSYHNKVKENKSNIEIINEYTEATKLNREMVYRLIDTIYIGTTDPTTKEKPIEIHWNF